MNEYVYELLYSDGVAGTPLHVTVCSCPWNYPYPRDAGFATEVVFNAYYEIAESKKCLISHDIIFMWKHIWSLIAAVL